MSDRKFINLCLSGDVLINDIDDFIDKWHDSDSNDEIYDYLGMTREEYFLWIERPEYLKIIMETKMSDRKQELRRILETINKLHSEKRPLLTRKIDLQHTIKENRDKKDKLLSLLSLHSAILQNTDYYVTPQQKEIMLNSFDFEMDIFEQNIDKIHKQDIERDIVKTRIDEIVIEIINLKDELRDMGFSESEIKKESYNI